MSFSALNLVSPLQRALAEAGYTKPTPIQEKAIGPALSGRDLFGCAQTGTGKTAAFALPILQRLDERAGENPRLRALVLAPTRELALQIGESFSTYGRHLELWHTVVHGGVSDKPQITELRRGVDLLVATPGRLLDLMNRGFVRLNEIEVFVLDEADRMLDMGFIHDVERIAKALPTERQTLLFSATMPPAILKLAQKLLRDPLKVSAATVAKPADKVEQVVHFVARRDKPDLLLEILRRPDCRSTLVFSRTKHGANRIAASLFKSGVSATAIHGGKSQGARTRALEGFRSGEVSVLVATDIAARGVDVAGITHVVNFDLPNEPETYVHRIGRTGRAGAGGTALSFCDEDERPYLADIERLIGARIRRHGQSTISPFRQLESLPSPKPERLTAPRDLRTAARHVSPGPAAARA